MSPLLALVPRASTVSGGGALPTAALPGMKLPPGRSTGPLEHPETNATASAQAKPVARTIPSRGRDGRLPAARGPQRTRGHDAIMNLHRQPTAGNEKAFSAMTRLL